TPTRSSGPFAVAVVAPSPETTRAEAAMMARVGLRMCPPAWWRPPGAGWAPERGCDQTPRVVPGGASGPFPDSVTIRPGRGRGDPLRLPTGTVARVRRHRTLPAVAALAVALGACSAAEESPTPRATSPDAPVLQP